MARIVLTILATVTFVAFALSNTQRVAVSFVVGEPIETRLIFLMLVTFALGFLGAFFNRMMQEANRRAQYRKIRVEMKKVVHKQLEHE